MSHLPLETIAIVGDMLDEVDGKRAAIMLRMRHHLPAPDRERLFVVVSGEAPLLPSFFAALRSRVPTRWPEFRPPPELCGDHAEVLEQAFGQALADVLGTRANRLVVNAWTATLRDFISEACRMAASGPAAPATIPRPREG